MIAEATEVIIVQEVKRPATKFGRLTVIPTIWRAPRPLELGRDVYWDVIELHGGVESTGRAAKFSKNEKGERGLLVGSYGYEDNYALHKDRFVPLDQVAHDEELRTRGVRIVSVPSHPPRMG